MPFVETVILSIMRCSTKTLTWYLWYFVHSIRVQLTVLLWSPALNFPGRTALWRKVCVCEVQGLTGNLARAVLGY